MTKIIEKAHACLMGLGLLLQGELLVKTVPAEGGTIYVTKSPKATMLRAGLLDIQSSVPRTGPVTMKHLPYQVADTCLGLFPEIKRVLILGLGGGSFCHAVLKKQSDAAVTGVDINPEIPKLARKYFRLPDAVKTVVADAADFIAADTGKYDLVFVDVFKGINTPESLCSETFMANLARIAAPDGVVVLNTIRTLSNHNRHDELMRLFASSFHRVELRTWPGDVIPVNAVTAGTTSTAMYQKLRKVILNEKRSYGTPAPILVG